MYIELPTIIIVGDIGRACPRKEMGLLTSEPRNPKVLRHQVVYRDVPGQVNIRWWHQQKKEFQLSTWYQGILIHA